MATAVFSRLAEADLDEIVAYAARDKPAAAARLVRRIRQTCDALAANPQMGDRRTEFASNVLRSFTVASYVIFFRAANDGIEVARILSGYRDWRTTIKRS